MKLRNKKTGEITEANDWNIISEYKSLAELNKEWEDYEEPKEYWLIDCTSSEGIDEFKESGDDVDIFNKSVGNYFETKEEAEKAVEKLKAWKRLKDKGFKFEGLGIDSWDKDDIKFAINLPENFDERAECQEIKDLNLLFGGEE